MLILINGCEHTYTQEDVIGTWDNPDGSVIKFNNREFDIKGIPLHLLNPEVADTNKLCSGIGKWKIQDNRINLDPIYLSGHELNNNQELFIEGSGNYIQIYFIIGDPDDVNFYRFTKSTNKKLSLSNCL